MQAGLMRLLLKSVFLMLALLLLLVPAMASPVQYTLDLGNDSVGGICGSGSGGPQNCPKGNVPGPYATVTLNLSSDSKSIAVTVQMLGNNSYVLWGNGSVFAFNYVGGAGRLSIGSISSDTGARFSAGSSAKMDGFGTFQYAIKTNQNKAVGQTLTFTVTRSDKGTFTSASDIATGTYAFAMDMASCGSNCTGRRYSGYAGGTPAPVPEPASIALFGTGLLTVGAFARKWRK